MDEMWSNIENKIEEFLYGERGLETTAYSDINLDTYNWNMDEIVVILKEIKKIYSSLNSNQKEKLARYKKAFLDIDNGENGVKDVYNQILEIYENIEEY